MDKFELRQTGVDHPRAILARLTYWQRRGKHSQSHQEGERRLYLTCEIDCGGLNNIRQAFEYAVVVAALTNRILVVPPPCAWYLINFGPTKRESEPDGISSIEEFFDLGDLGWHLPVMSAIKFSDLERDRMEIPAEFFPEDVPYDDVDFWGGVSRRWNDWLRSNALQVLWNPYNNVIFYPDIQAVLGGPCSPASSFMDNRVAVEIDDTMAACTVLHLPCDPSRGLRHLGQVSTMVAFDRREGADFVRRLLRNGVHYVPEVFAVAARLIGRLGMFRYAAIHIRRNDFQFTEVKISGDIIAGNIDGLLLSSEPLYVATDEPDPDFLEPLRQRRQVWTWSDLVREVDDLDVPLKLVACVEQVVCAGARVFVGTRYSTMSSYVVRLRGYIGAPNTGTYFHTEYPRDELMTDHSIRPVCGRDYLREDARLWADAREDRGPDYCVVCTDTHPSVQWQCELLEHTWRAVGQPGRLIRLMATDSADPLPEHRWAQVLRTRFSNVHPDSGDEYPPYNRLYSLWQWLLEHKPHGTVLILDPDYVFRAPVTGSVRPGTAQAQLWVSRTPWSEQCRFMEVMPDVSIARIEDLQNVTWPALIHTDDLSRLVPRWIELTAEYRRRTGAWESDMVAFTVAAAEIGLSFELRVFAAWMNWPEDIVRGGPIVHYCQKVEDHDGNILWWKRDYRPWRTIEASPPQARLDYCRDLLGIVKRFVALRRAEVKGPDQRKEWLEVRVLLRGHEPLTFLSESSNPALADLIRTVERRGPTEEMLYLQSDGKERFEFTRADLIGIETLPAVDVELDDDASDWVDLTVRVAGMPSIAMRAETGSPAIKALKEALSANRKGEPEQVMFLQIDESERLYLLRSSLQALEIGGFDE